jgi:hypothetical protein
VNPAEDKEFDDANLFDKKRSELIDLASTS